LATLLKAAPRHPHLKLIVIIDELEPEIKQFAAAWSQTQGVKLQDLSECRSYMISCVYFQAIRYL
jgi:hypothetical protein